MCELSWIFLLEHLRLRGKAEDNELQSVVASIHAALDRLEATRSSAVSRSEAPNAEPDPLIREEQGERRAIVYSMHDSMNRRAQSFQLL